MTAYVAMLRGINVGGHAKVAMADLRHEFADLGYDDVRTYIQSGNVLFEASASASALLAAIERRLEARFALPIKVVLRTHAQLAGVVDRNPLRGGGREPARLHVTFLASKPPAARVAGLDDTAFAPDEFRVVGREVYLHCPGGYGNTKLNNAFFERKLGVGATTRTWKTVTTLRGMGS